VRLGTITIGSEAIAMTAGEIVRAVVLLIAGLIVGIVLGLAVLVGLGAMSAGAHAAGAKWPGPHPVDVLRVLDGDTIRVRMRDGPCGRGPCPGAEVSIRVRGIDTPEIHRCRSTVSQSCAACDAEVAAGQRASAEARRILAGAAVRVRAIGPDPYAGRYVATLEVLTGDGWRDYGQMMISRDLAVPYDPEGAGSYRKSKPWCARDEPAAGPTGSAGGAR
jgi:endonuclease YncB( thermonuclease family)